MTMKEVAEYFDKKIEEVGLDVEIDEQKRYVLNYLVNNEIDKTTVLYIAKPISNKIVKQDSEIEEVRWCSFEETLDTLTFENWNGKEVETTEGKVKYEIEENGTYKITEEKILNLSPKTTYKEFRNNIETNMEYKVETKEGDELGEEEYVGTGMKVKVE